MIHQNVIHQYQEKIREINQISLMKKLVIKLLLSYKLFEPSKDNPQFKKLFKIFKKFGINDLFVEAITQMLKCAKFFKDILSNKKR